MLQLLNLLGMSIMLRENCEKTWENEGLISSKGELWEDYWELCEEKGVHVL